MIRVLAIGAVVAAVWLTPSTATAQSLVTFTPSLSIGSVYDDNLFARTVGTGDQMTLLTPGIEASYSNPRAAFLGLYTFDMLEGAPVIGIIFNRDDKARAGYRRDYRGYFPRARRRPSTSIDLNAHQ